MESASAGHGCWKLLLRKSIDLFMTPEPESEHPWIAVGSLGCNSLRVEDWQAAVCPERVERVSRES